MSMFRLDISVGQTKIRLAVIHEKVVFLNNANQPVKIAVCELDAADLDWLRAAWRDGRPPADLPTTEHPLSPGMLLVRAAVRLYGSPTAVAKKTGYTQQQVKSWMSGAITPGDKTSSKIRRILPVFPTADGDPQPDITYGQAEPAEPDSPAAIARRFFIEVHKFKEAGDWLYGDDEKGRALRARVLENVTVLESSTNGVHKEIGRFEHKGYQIDLWKKKIARAATYSAGQK